MAKGSSGSSVFVGIADAILVVPSHLPFAMICGLAAKSAGINPIAAITMPAIVFAGSSQAIVASVIQNSGSILMALLTGLIINIRFLAYSAAMADRTKNISLFKRICVAFFLLEHSYALVERRSANGYSEKKILSYFAGLTIVFWPCWVLFCALGFFPQMHFQIVGTWIS